MKSQDSSVIRIGAWRVDPALDEISKDGRTTKLEPRMMRLLVCLAAHAGQVVSVEQLLDEVWKGVVVTPDSVYQAVAALRRMLGDDSRNPSYIVNVLRRGYRLIAPVMPLHPAQELGTAPTPDGVAPSIRPRWIRLLLIVLVLALGYLGVQRLALSTRSATLQPSPPVATSVTDESIAVLAFEDLSERQDQGYFADGMAEEVRSLLATVPHLKVVGRISSFQFKGKRVDLRTIGSLLGVNHLVDGSVRKAESRVRVSAELIDARTGVREWSQSYDRDYGDVLAMQDQIAGSIARSLQLGVGGDDFRVARRLRSTEAYTLYLEGRSLLDQGTALHQAQDDFARALELDPTFAAAAEWLGVSYDAELGDDLIRSDIGWPRVRGAALTLLQLDPDSALAHALLGHLHSAYEYDWPSAAVELDKTLKAKARDSIALEFAAWIALGLGRHDEAVRLIDTARSMDPLNPDVYGLSGIIRFQTGDFDVAERHLRKSLEISPTEIDVHEFLGAILVLRGHPAEALKEIELEVPMGSRDAGLAIVYYALGRKRDSDEALARLIHDYGELWPSIVAQVYTYRGETNRAFEWLDKALVARPQYFAMTIRTDPFLAPLRSDPRFSALLRKMNLAAVD